MKRVSLLLVAAMILVSGQALGFSIANIGGKDVKWKTAGFDYWLDHNGYPGITNDSDRQVCKQSFQEWSAISCANFTLNYAGDTTVSKVLPTSAQPNGKNEVIWTDTGWPFGLYVLGVTSPLYGFDGEIIEADVAFNPSWKWVTSGANYYNTMDIKSVAIHEFGHMYGIQHNLEPDYYNPPTMAPSVNESGKSASLEQDDKDALCYLYPATAWSCNNDSKCPYVVSHNSSDEEYYSAKYKCQSGKCVWGTVYPLSGQKDLGGTCSEQWQCKAPFFCLPTSNAFCTRWCTEAAPDCPVGFTCASIDNGPDGVCIKNGQTGSVAAGGGCWASVECKSGLYCQDWITGGFCTSSCNDPNGGTGCPAGYTCGPSTTSPTGAGCFLGTSSKAENGESCSSNMECKSGLCFANPVTGGTKCRAACNPQNPSCPATYRCIEALNDPSGTTGACIPLSSLPQIPNGIACTKSWECQSNFCFLDPEDNSSLCRAFCQQSSHCPSGHLCAFDAKGLGGCVPGPAVPLATGASCVHGYDCQSGRCVALPGSTKKYCRDACNPETPCPTGAQCINYVSPQAGYCMPQGADTNAVCSAANECTTFICWSPEGVGKCRLPCAAGTCPVGSVCTPLTPFGPVCIAAEGEGGYDVGVACDDKAQCKSEICLSGICAQPCNLLQPECPAGSGCVPLADGSAGACTLLGTMALGDACASDFDCASLLCIEAASVGRICVQPCSDQAPCPEAEKCVAIPEMEGLGACLDEQTGGEDISYPKPDVVSPEEDAAVATDTTPIQKEVAPGGTCSASPTGTPGTIWVLMFAALLLGIWRLFLRRAVG